MDALREHLEKDGFRLRGLHVARIDAFSDVVFGFALTLLVVSLEVPKTFAQLHASLREFVPFGICFYFLMVVWYHHYQFFRRFGTHDTRTIAINGILLFVVLFYVYPLKFLFTVVSYGMMGLSSDAFDNQHQVRELMVLYALGFAAIHLLFAALYWNGWRQRHELDLTLTERLLTKTYIASDLSGMLVGLLACALALAVPEHWAGYTGYTYALMWPVGTLIGRIKDRKLKRMREQAAVSA
jgi:uncharacterized membrane protein